MTGTETDDTTPIDAGRAIVTTIDALPPTAPTACEGWTVHEIVAHLAAGSKEQADLIEERLAGRPERPTQGFEERETPFRALPDDELRDRWIEQSRRKLAAHAALVDQAEPTIAFTGTHISAAELTTHSRSEATIHRWDLVGDDDIAEELLTDPQLTAHAVKVLNRMPILNESARSLGHRTGDALAQPTRIVFRSGDQPDVAFTASGEGGRFELTDQSDDHTALVTTDPAHRLLLLWRRRSTNRTLTTDGDPDTVEALPAIFWPHAHPWP